GDNRAAQTGLARRLDVADRTLVGLDTLLANQLEHQIVFAIADSAHRLLVGRIAGIAPGEIDPARLQKRLDSVVARFAVDVLVVVGHPVELLELLAATL